MKKTKIIVPALGMLLLSTAASVTGTVAWFAVNTEVSVTGLQVKAKAEGGIVIAPYTLTPSSVTTPAGDPKTNTKTDFAFVEPAKAAFGQTATNSLDLAALYPTSTANASAWYHATSNAYDNYAASSTYTDVAGLAGWQADGKLIEGNGGGSNPGDAPYTIAGQYFLYNKFKVKSTTEADSFSLYVRTITVTDANEETSSLLNQSLRVAMKAGSADPVFFAPKRASAPENPYGTGEGVPTVLQCYGGSKQAAVLNYGLTPNAQIANNTVNNTGIDLQIWVYYEGEDPQCKTVNIDGITVDELTLRFDFATTSAA